MPLTRCAVTGLGMICGLGNNADECWNNAVSGKSGIKEVEGFGTEGCYAHLGCEVKDTNSQLASEDYDRSSLLCIHAAEEAVRNAGFDSLPDNTGVIMGSCVGGAESIDRFFGKKYTDKKEKENLLQKMTASAIAGNVAAHFSAGGITANIVNACAAGTMSVAYACDLIRLGKGEVFLAGGTDSFSTLAYSGFHALKALSAEPCSPFNHSNGITLGEGAGVLVIESYEHAVKRGARIYCEILGSGISSDAYHITAPRPDGKGQMYAINEALKNSDLTAGDIDYINAHGTGTAKNDEAEILSIHELFGESKKLSVSSTKSMTGHCLGAAGALEAVFCVKAISENCAPPTVGYTDEDKAAFAEKADTTDFIQNESRRKEIDCVMSNSFAFGGTNASIIFSKKPSDVPDRSDNGKVYITGIGTAFDKDYAEKFSQLGIKNSFIRKLDNFSLLQLYSGVSALHDAGIEVTDDNKNRIGIIIGTANGPVTEITNFQKRVYDRGIENGSAFSFPNTVYNAAGGYLSIATGVSGYSMTIANGAQAGLQSICAAMDVIKLGKADIMCAAGTDEASEFFEGFEYADRLSNGSATVVLETAKSAASRKAKIYAEVAGCSQSHLPTTYGESFDAAGAVSQAVKNACENAGISLDDIDAVCGFSDGSQAFDLIEMKIYNDIFKNSLPLFSVSSSTGNCAAASANAQAAYAAKLLNMDKCEIPMKIFYNGQINESKISTDMLNTVLAVSYGKDGSCSCVILKKAGEDQ